MAITYPEPTALRVDQTALSALLQAVQSVTLDLQHMDRSSDHLLRRVELVAVTVPSAPRLEPGNVTSAREATDQALEDRVSQILEQNKFSASGTVSMNSTGCSQHVNNLYFY